MKSKEKKDITSSKIRKSLSVAKQSLDDHQRTPEPHQLLETKAQIYKTEIRLSNNSFLESRENRAISDRYLKRKSREKLILSFTIFSPDINEIREKKKRDTK
ncbi:hypothetical protein ACOSQ3_026132 [Xanthoceras sorbifolium]